MMRIECVSALSMLRALHFIKNGLFLWLVKRLLIRSVLFLSINPSELEEIVLGAFSLAARPLFVYPRSGCATHQPQFIITAF